MIDRAAPDLAAPDLTRRVDLSAYDDGGHWTYPGGKNGEGVWQRIISQMPPHEQYIEPFLGSGAVMRRKRPASSNVGIDMDAGVIARHGAACDRSQRQIERGRPDRFEFIHGNAVEWLQQQRDWRGAVVYCDPPYLGEARCRPRAVYTHEMLGQDEHEALLRILAALPAMVMISGYPSPVYESALKGWRRIEYQAQTRGGLKPEVLWMNFPEPVQLHDYRFLGRDFRERCRITRKIKRWTGKLRKLPALERAAILAALQGV